MGEIKVLHNLDAKDFIIQTNGDNKKSLLQYNIIDNKVIDFHRTFVPEEHRGKGYAQELVKSGLNFAEKNNYSVKASCSFVKKYLERHSL